MDETLNTLYDLTGHESGAVCYGDGSIWVGNWSGIAGIPRAFGMLGMIGNGEDLYAEPTEVPPEAMEAMEAHTDALRQAGEQIVSGAGDREGYTALVLPAHQITVVTHDQWA